MGVDAWEIEEDALTIIKKCQADVKDKLEIKASIRNIHQNKSQFYKIWFNHILIRVNQTGHIIVTESLKRE